MNTEVKTEKGQFWKILPDGRYGFWVDHHLIDTFNTCERKFYLQHVLRMRLKGPIKSVLTIGQWWSSVMEDYYEALASGQLASQGVALALGIAAKHWIGYKMSEIQLHDPKKYNKFALPLGPADLKRLSPELALATEQIATLVPVGPLLMIYRYHHNYYEHDQRNWKIISAERGFGLKNEVLLGENDKVAVYYVGRPDLVVYEPGTDVLEPVDHKTSDYVAWDVNVKYKPHSQTANYINAVAKIAQDMGVKQIPDRCIINVCGRQEPAEGKARFTRVYVNYSQEELAEYKRMLVAKATRLRECIEKDEWIWKESQCHMYSGCEYRRVDSHPPGAREGILKSDFVQVEPWASYDVED